MSFSRRTLLKATAASAVLGGIGAPVVARAQAAEFTYKYANNLPDSHPLNTRAKEMAAAIKAETNGRFDLQIFPNNQLGSDTDMLSQIRSGGIEFFTLSGLILSTLVSPLWTSMFKAFDAAPASINFSEVYSALQTKIVEGQENPLAIISTAKLYEVQKYCSLTNHMWDGFWFLANRRAWNAVPEDVRAIVAKHINAAAVNERADVAKLNAGLQKDLADKGSVFNQPNTAPFRDKLRSQASTPNGKANTASSPGSC
jgi:TRAP-type C4-dicarboxylate transport system substrate-binding protein